MEFITKIICSQSKKTYTTKKLLTKDQAITIAKMRGFFAKLQVDIHYNSADEKVYSSFQIDERGKIISHIFPLITRPSTSESLST